MKNEYEIRGETTAIFLKRKDGSVLETIIDTIDLEKANSFDMTWFSSWESHTSSYYCGGAFKAIKRKQKKVKFHRYILDCPDGMVVDHINHDTLDNRRLNLRVTDHASNSQNRNGLDSNNKSGVRGVSWSTQHKSWCVTIRCKGKTHFFGRHKIIEDAKRIAESEYNRLHSKLPL